MRSRVIEVELDRYASLVRGPGARELVVEVRGRPPMWVALARGYSVSEKTARDVICAAELRGYAVVVTTANGGDLVPITWGRPGEVPRVDSSSGAQVDDPGAGLW